MSDLFTELESYNSNLEKVEEKVDSVPTGYIRKDDSAGELFLESISKMGYDLTELEGALKSWDNQLVLSCAGSGKTTMITFKTIYGTRTGKLTKKVEVNGNTIRTMQNIWISTFLNTGAKELRYELSKWNKKLGYRDTSSAINFSTIHAEFKRVLNDCGIATNFISEKENTTILKNVLKNFGVRSKGRFLNSEQIRDLKGALTYTRNICDNTRYIHDTYRELGLSYIEIDAILTKWFEARQAGGKMDFEDLQDILYDKLFVEEDQNVIDHVMNSYDYIFIDEFQDTSQKQYAIIKAYTEGAKRIIAVGDDDQTIYSWRGSDNSIITKKFIEDFNPTISKLSTNYRCPANILNSIVPSIVHNTERLEKSIKASKEGGELRYGAFSSYNSMVRKLNDLIAQDVKDGMEVAVICRENVDALLPAIMLDRDGRFTFSISSDDMALNSYMVKQVVNIVRLVTEKATSGVSSALKQLTYSSWEVDSLLSALKNSGESIWNVPLDDLSYSCPSVSGIIESWRKVRDQLSAKEDYQMDLVEFLLTYYNNHVYTTDSTYDMRMRSIISAFIVLVRSDGFTRAGEFLYELEEMNLRLQSRKGLKNASVKLVTGHEFKGKEVDSSYTWNDSVDVFPHKKSSTEKDLEEERRLHYIACTRAKKRMTIMTIQGQEGMFVKEMDLSNAEVVNVIKSVKGSLKGRDANVEARNRRRLLDEMYGVDRED